VASFVVEVYAPNLGRSDLADVAQRAEAAARDLRSEGLSVRYLRSVLVPEDDTCFHHVEGPSADAIRRLSERAGLFADDHLVSIKRSMQHEHTKAATDGGPGDRGSRMEGGGSG
jgi:hypothetical protein